MQLIFHPGAEEDVLVAYTLFIKVEENIWKDKHPSVHKGYLLEVKWDTGNGGISY